MLGCSPRYGERGLAWHLAFGSTTWIADVSRVPVTPARRSAFFERAAFAQCNRHTPVPIDLKHLRYADLAERCGSFRKAADLLALKQSNLSRGIRHLEDQLGVRLFERNNGGVRATPAGRNFIRGARRVLAELEAVIDGVRA